METKKEQFDGYFLVPDEYGWCMVLESPWSASYRDIILNDRISTLRLSKSAGWRAEDLHFLSELPDLKGLEIYNWDVVDISPVNKLRSLRKLDLECNYKTAPHFSAFNELKMCFLHWRPNSDDLFRCCRLESLNIVNYPYSDLNPLGTLHRLRSLKLTSSKLIKLKGIELMPSLEVLDLFQCTKLNSLSGIEKCSNLKKLKIETCKGIAGLDPISDLMNLKHLSLNNCKAIKSLKPLAHLPKLSELYFIESTNIVDGDLSVFEQLPELRDMWFTNRNHYSHSREDIKRALDQRTGISR